MDIVKITAQFINEDEIYGTEEFYLAGVSPEEIETKARELASGSHYDDDRLPDRHVALDFEAIELDQVPEGAVIHGLVSDAPKP